MLLLGSLGWASLSTLHQMPWVLLVCLSVYTLPCWRKDFRHRHFVPSNKVTVS